MRGIRRINEHEIHSDVPHGQLPPSATECLAVRRHIKPQARRPVPRPRRGLLLPHMDPHQIASYTAAAGSSTCNGVAPFVVLVLCPRAILLRRKSHNVVVCTLRLDRRRASLAYEAVLGRGDFSISTHFEYASQRPIVPSHWPDCVSSTDATVPSPDPPTDARPASPPGPDAPSQAHPKTYASTATIPECQQERRGRLENALPRCFRAPRRDQDAGRGCRRAHAVPDAQDAVGNGGINMAAVAPGDGEQSRLLKPSGPTRCTMPRSTFRWPTCRRHRGRRPGAPRPFPHDLSGGHSVDQLRCRACGLSRREVPVHDAGAGNRVSSFQAG